MLRKSTRSGKELALKFLDSPPMFKQGDILYADEQSVIAVEILPCEVIVIHPASPQQLAAVCYEIGNRHLPLFFENGEVLTPCEEPLFRWMVAMGYAVRWEMRPLAGQLRTTVPAHVLFASSERSATPTRISPPTNPDA